MVSILPTEILLFFLLSVAVAFLVPFFCDGIAKQVKPQFDLLSLKYLACFLAPFLAIFCLGQYLESAVATGLSYFALGAIVPFILTRFNFGPRLSGILILVASVLTTMILRPSVPGEGLLCVLSGLIVWKILDMFFYCGAQTLEDALPAIIWMGGVDWINTISAEAAGKTEVAMLASTLSVVLLLRVFQGPLLHEDKLYLKRIVLAASGGLVLLILVNKVLVAPDLATMTALIGAGIFMTYLVEPMTAEQPEWMGAAQAVKFLVLIGIFTLLGSRLFGTYGLVVLAPTVLVASRSSIALSAGLYWIARATLQSYVYLYNPNVTGINLTHPYTSAALYAGFLGALLASLLLRDNKSRWMTTSLFLAGGALLPLFSNYLLHEEPTGSLLVSVTVASVILAVCAPALYRQDMPHNAGMMLLPALMSVTACLSAELINAGNEATSAAKTTVLLYVLGAFVVASLIAWWFTSGSRRQPVEVSGN